MTMDEEKCKEEFIKAGFWPNQVMWAAWKKAWALGAADEKERCARLCEEIVTYPAGHGGQWEGYGPVNKTRDGKACAAEIRARVSGSKGRDQ